MISVDGSVFIQIVNFLFLVWVMNKLVYKPIRKILLERKEAISGLQQGVESAETQAKEKDNAYALGLREARTKGLQAKEEFLEAAAEEEKAIIDKINQKAQAELTAIRSKISEDAETVRASLENEIDTFADAIGNKILGRAI
jgi:F-type H+-transporting ATPase subunit b